MFVIQLILMLGLVSSVIATTRHVPVDYPTIQAALDTLSAGDTVLIDVGVYEEALEAPALPFVLRGNVTPDTGDYPRPIVDPSSLSNPTGRTCLRMDSGAVIIEDIVFRNRLRMYPHTADTTGGVYHPHGQITLRRCVFDSTFNALSAYWADVSVSECDFRNLSGIGIRSTHSVVATDCNFHSNMVLWAQLSSWGNSRVERCHFWGSHDTQMILICSGDNVQIRDCVFGPGDASVGERFYFLCWNSVFENNIIENWSVGQGIFYAHVNGAGRLEIRNNILRNCFTPLAYPERWLYGFDLQMQQACDSCVIEFADNLIENCSSNWGAPGLLTFGGRIEARRNRFARLFPKAVWSRDSAFVLRDNLIYENGTGLESDSGVATDARWNWWGDSTGPYHNPLNPNGQGDEIRGDHMVFAPWHTDTNFFSDAIPERPLPLPQSVTLAVFPNPFNSETTLKFTVPDPLIARVELFDITGRRVRELWRGLVVHEKEIALHGNDLASGIYFVRATENRGSRALAIAKVVLLK